MSLIKDNIAIINKNTEKNTSFKIVQHLIIYNKFVNHLKHKFLTLPINIHNNQHQKLSTS